MNLLDKTAERVNKYGNNGISESVKRAFSFLSPVFLIGAGALTLQNFPLKAVREFIQGVWNGFFNNCLTAIYNATFGFAAVYLVIMLTYTFTLAKKTHRDVKVFFVLNSVMCYFASLGKILIDEPSTIISYTNMSNIFQAMIISIAAYNLFGLFYKLFNRSKFDHVSSFDRALHSILPLLCCVLVFTFVSALIGLLDGVNNFNDLIINVFSKPFESINSTYLGGMLIMLAESVFWFFGIHGGNVFDTILNSSKGNFAFSGGQIMSKPFVDTFVLMGGCGTSVCLFIALLIFTKNRRKKKLCRLTSVPVLFNINELLVFGIPIVLNPIYIIPFILTPIICYNAAYLATTIGVLPHIVNPSVQWTTPIIISGYQATGSALGSLWQLILIAIGVATYAPFVFLDNKIIERSEKLNIDKLTEICRECEAHGEEYSIQNESHALRVFEDDVAAKLYGDISNENIYLKYQPQVKDGKIIAAEALLRFKYNNEKFLYPPLVIAIACKNDLFETLSQEIVKRAIKDLEYAQKVMPDFKIAVNLKLELIEKNSFRNWLIESINKSDLMPHTFGVEITEDANISDIEAYSEGFNELRQAGVEVHMDDFSMGHTSIAILQKNYFDYIKIDGNLIKQLDNERIRSIVASIVKLGKELNFKVIAEYVETEKQRDILLGMGCDIFQGYLYYKDLPVEELTDILAADSKAADAATNQND